MDTYNDFCSNFENFGNFMDLLNVEFFFYLVLPRSIR